MKPNKIYLLQNLADNSIETYSNKSLLYKRIEVLAQEPLLSYSQFSNILKNLNQAYKWNRFIKNKEYYGSEYLIYISELNQINDSKHNLPKQISRINIPEVHQQIIYNIDTVKQKAVNKHSLPKIMLVGEPGLLIDGLETQLKYSDGIVVVATVNTSESALEFLNEKTIDIAVVFIDSMKEGFLPLITSMKNSYPEIKILVIDQTKGSLGTRVFAEFGVEGYMLIEESSADFLYAIKSLASGDEYWSDKAFQKYRASLLKFSKRKERKEVVLTKREEDVLKLIATEHTSGEISSKLNIENTTVATHRRNLVKKLGVKSSLGLVRYAIEKGYLAEGAK